MIVCSYPAVVSIPPPKHTSDGASVTTLDQYKKLWNESVKGTRLHSHNIATIFSVNTRNIYKSDPSKFWGDMAQKHLTWKVCQACQIRAFSFFLSPIHYAPCRFLLITSRLAVSSTGTLLGLSMARYCQNRR